MSIVILSNDIYFEEPGDVVQLVRVEDGNDGGIAGSPGCCLNLKIAGFFWADFAESIKENCF